MGFADRTPTGMNDKSSRKRHGDCRMEQLDLLRLVVTTIDRSYIDDWCLKLGLEAVWKAVQARTDEP